MIITIGMAVQAGVCTTVAINMVAGDAADILTTISINTAIQHATDRDALSCEESGAILGVPAARAATVTCVIEGQKRLRAGSRNVCGWWWWQAEAEAEAGRMAGWMECWFLLGGCR